MKHIFFRVLRKKGAELASQKELCCREEELSSWSSCSCSVHSWTFHSSHTLVKVTLQKSRLFLDISLELHDVMEVEIRKRLSLSLFKLNIIFYKVIQGLLYSPCKKSLLNFQSVEKVTATLKAVKENLGASLTSTHWNSFMVEDAESTVVCLKK